MRDAKSLWTQLVPHGYCVESNLIRLLYFTVSWIPWSPVPSHLCGTWHFIFDGCKVSLMCAFGAFHKHQSSLLCSGELSFSFSLLMCSSSRWSMMAKLLDSQDLPMEDPVSNMPTVAVVFGLRRAIWSVWIRSQGNNERPNQGRANHNSICSLLKQLTIVKCTY